MDLSRDWAFQARRTRRFSVKDPVSVKDPAKFVLEETPVLLLLDELTEVDIQTLPAWQ
jgi:hypothetical protein